MIIIDGVKSCFKFKHKVKIKHKIGVNKIFNVLSSNNESLDMLRYFD